MGAGDLEELSPIFIRRTKDEVLGNVLPAKSEERLELCLSEKQIMLYHQLVQDYQRKLAEEENIALATIQKMIMLCSHPRLLTKSNENVSSRELLSESPKLQWTVDKLAEIKRKKEKVVIFTGYKRMQAILRHVIYEEFGIDSKIINGEVKDNRLGIIEDFGNRKGFNVLILSPKAAGVGLNIVAANHVIHYTREWNPAIESQATDRVYRIGQEKDVSVYYPVMNASEFITAEIRLDQLLNEKKDLMKRVIVPSDLSITWKDFKDVIA